MVNVKLQTIKTAGNSRNFMKISIKKDTHIGNQPIRVLKHNLTSRLEERNEEYIKSLQSDFKLNKSIIYNIKDLPLNQKQLPLKSPLFTSLVIIQIIF